MGDFFEDLKKFLVLKRKPTDNMPWGEMEYLVDGGIDRFVEFVNKLNNYTYLNLLRQPLFFRGQGDSCWGLEPSLYRLVKGIPLGEALRIEFDAIRYFKQQSRSFFRPQMIPKDEDDGEWLAIMQQYGAPTRMLDWTTSFNVALYFTVNDKPMDKPGAVWFFGPEDLSKVMSQYVDLPEDEGQAIRSNPDKFVKYGEKAPPQINLHEPKVKSERMVAQQGVFTYCEQLFCDQAKLIGEALLASSHLSKIVIGPQAKKQMREYLNKLNITAAVLFPGVEGLGRAISEMITVHREVFYSGGLKV